MQRKKIRVLVIGNGGREHSIVEVLSRSQRVERVYCAPGNPGIQEQAQTVPIQSDQILELRDFAESHSIDWTIVGSEVPLSLGLVDSFQEKGLKCLGVNEKASQLEASKVFTKNLLSTYQIPTASFEVFEDFSSANSFFRENPASKNHPWVIKVDGLAGGKGVYILSDPESVNEALHEIFIQKRFQEQRIVVEEFLQGREISVFALSDGENLLPFSYAQDFKKRDENDQGPNTGGMGAFTPVSWMSENLQKKIQKEILKPTLQALKNEGILYQGILYAGLMVCEENPEENQVRVLEYNVRLGDPEAQVILSLLETDFVDILDAMESQRVHELELEWKKESSICISLASLGYPLKYEQGFLISGIEKVKTLKGIEVLHAGTRMEGPNLLTNGGRVLHIVARAKSLKEAREKGYRAVDLIQFQNRFFRKDIAKRELDELQKQINK